MLSSRMLSCWIHSASNWHSVKTPEGFFCVYHFAINIQEAGIKTTCPQRGQNLTTTIFSDFSSTCYDRQAWYLISATSLFCLIVFLCQELLLLFPASNAIISHHTAKVHFKMPRSGLFQVLCWAVLCYLGFFCALWGVPLASVLLGICTAFWSFSEWLKEWNQIKNHRDICILNVLQVTALLPQHLLGFPFL